MEPSKKPIINAHAHVFTHEYVPPYLAKKIIPWPLYYGIHLPTLVRIARWYKRSQRAFKYTPKARRFWRNWYALNTFFRRNILGLVFSILVKVYFSLFTILTIYIWLRTSGSREDILVYDGLNWMTEKMVEFNLLAPKNYWISIPIVLLSILFIKQVRRLITFIFKKIGALVKLMPSKESRALLGRYYMMIQFAIYRQQSRINGQLLAQYPRSTEFVLLPMDMEYMGAGKLKNKKAFVQQHELLAKMRQRNNRLHPFVFIDPRRIREEGKTFFNYSIVQGKVVLLDCVIKRFIEDEGFKGFKIYPALGYFPFDDDLLILWKYAADNQIPIMSHGVKGVIYYRGKKLKTWDYHEVFMESIGDKTFVPMALTEKKNKDFQINFTHPMNFLCLLEESLLRKLVEKSKKEDVRSLFGFEDKMKPLKQDLNHLKVCFAHFGGNEEWGKYYEQDRNYYSQRIRTSPNTGIDFFKDSKISWGRLELLWKGTDWYSIICSMMIQYPNFYADISYTVSDPTYYPLLKQTVIKGDKLNKGQEILRKKVLFGTDFYVVRSQMADKRIIAELQSFLTEEEFDLIARENTHNYLKQTSPELRK